MIGQAKKSLRNVLRTVAPSLLSSHIRNKWDHEPEYFLLPALCDRRRISFDVGANWGQYAGALKDLSAGVIACEPIPELARFLRRSYGRAIRVEQTALSNKTGIAEFVVQSDWSYSSLGGPSASNGRKRLPVPLKTLDSLAGEPVGFIKVDVEGHEEEVLEGAANVLARDRPVLLTEIEERHRPGALTRIRAAMSAQGYRGCFLYRGFLHDIARFRHDEHQSPANIPSTGDTKYGTYINNFLFIHESCHAAKVKALADLGYLFAD